MVDVMFNTADNTMITVMARYYSIPRSENLARLMISMLSEQLRSCHFLKKGMGTKTKKCVRNPNEWQEVRHSHIIEEVCESRWRKGLCTL